MVVISDTKSSWREGITGVPQGLILGPILINIFVSGLGEGTESILSKFVDDAKLGNWEDWLMHWMVLLPFGGTFNSLEKCAQRNLKKFSKGQSQVLLLGRSNLMHQYRVGAEWLESSLAEKALRILANSKLTMSQQRVLAAKKATASWAALGEKQALEDLINVQEYLARDAHNMESDSSQWYPVTGQEAMGTN
ncbi:rna-directed dna polymerase from mobile element jockey-like [Limosa lapponica baueri]|uniref:Rna-directed dna polymerase from mobile element jockey-like n=1 Tax=Limosa lapponica baueri TaxID=1758121 RepID=A0A2I0U826_LIMLA|nr:rna-directed dna polymerase from mobile element jockey-like [Limosa lapponica baueri]